MTDEERNDERSEERSPTERAEEFLDRAGQTAGFFAANVGWRMARFASRAREEAEDMLAEAQYVREEMRSANDEDAEDWNLHTDGDASDTVDDEARNAFAAAKGEAGDGFEATDAVRRAAEEHGVDLTEVKGTGGGGRITVEDVRKEAGAGS